MPENRIVNIANTSMMIETQFFLNNCERFLDALKQHRGIVVQEEKFQKAVQHIIEGIYPHACGILDNVDTSLTRAGYTRLKTLQHKLKGWGF